MKNGYRYTDKKDLEQLAKNMSELTGLNFYIEYAPHSVYASLILREHGAKNYLQREIRLDKLKNWMQTYYDGMIMCQSYCTR